MLMNDDKLIIEDVHGKRAALKAVLFDQVEWNYAVNGDYTLTFTAYDDGSEAYSMLTNQSWVYDHGEIFVIKQVSDAPSQGSSAIQVTCSQIYTELSRSKSVDGNTDWGDIGHKASPDSNAPNQTNQDNKDDENTSLTPIGPEQIMKYYIGDANNTNGNNWLNFTWEIKGNFNPQPVALDAVSLKTGISKITETWTDAVIFPVAKHIIIYSHDEFYKDRGHRLDYLNNVSDIQIDIDSNSIINEARCVGATYTQQDTSTVDTGLPNGTITGGKGAQAVINDAKKYLGVPYVYGGAGGTRGGNPWSGMDCSSFVSQVYQDFGIRVPAQTVAMEPSFHQVSTPQTGDVGFYGPHGGTHHICLMLDANTMIYEPEPGESCKIEPVSYFPPSWYARNDQMAAIVSQGASGGDDGTDATTTTETDTTQYYFQPFIVKDQESIDRWGLFFAPDDITNDSIQDKDQMKEYALKQFHPNPDMSITCTMMNNERPIPGDIVHFEIKQRNYKSKLPIVGFTWYSHRKSSNNTTITLNSVEKSILDYEQSFNNAAKRPTQIINPGWSKQTWTRQEVRTFGENIEKPNTDQDTNNS